MNNLLRKFSMYFKLFLEFLKELFFEVKLRFWVKNYIIGIIIFYSYIGTIQIFPNICLLILFPFAVLTVNEVFHLFLKFWIGDDVFFVTRPFHPLAILIACFKYLVIYTAGFLIVPVGVIYLFVRYCLIVVSIKKDVIINQINRIREGR